jgi:hypothetical protein
MPALVHIAGQLRDELDGIDSEGIEKVEGRRKK